MRRSFIQFGMLFSLLCCVAQSGISQQEDATSGAVWRIIAYELIAPGSGWAASSTNLYWTDDNGASWKDITPPQVSSRTIIQNAYFADRLRGWAPLMKTAIDPTSVYKEDPSLSIFRVAMTEDGGSSWKVSSSVSKIPFDPAKLPPQDSSISFSDNAHGWILVSNSSSQLSRSGVLLQTADGGAHWKALPRPPIDGEIRFASARDGILTTNENPYADTAVWYTHDGGLSWIPSTLPVPKGCPECVLNSIDRATFTGLSSAVVTASMRTPEVDDLRALQYVTLDGGATWHLRQEDKILGSNVNLGVQIVKDGHTVAYCPTSDKSLAVTIDGKKSVYSLPQGLRFPPFAKASIASDLSGWALTSDRMELLSIDPKSGQVRIITPQ